MISARPAEDCPDELARTCQKFSQGDLIEEPRFFYWADLSAPLWDLSRSLKGTVDDDSLLDLDETQVPPYGLITTQTCDLHRPDQQPWMQVAPVFTCEEESSILSASFIHRLDPPRMTVPPGHSFYVDTRIEFPVEKGVLMNRQPIESFNSEDEYVRLSQFLANRVGRPALHSVFNAILNEVVREMKRTASLKTKLRGVRQEIHSLRVTISDGTRLKPLAAQLHVCTTGAPSEGIKDWFGEWWVRANPIASAHGLKLQAVSWVDATQADLSIYDQMISVSSGQIEG